MSDPTIYVPSYSFSGYQATNPAKPLPAPQVDNELANISLSLTETVNALEDIRRSDGQLQNGIVTVDSFSPGLTLGFTLKGGWTLGAHYILGDGVFYLGKCYRCQVVNDATNANRPDVDSVTWVLLYSVTDLTGAMSIATYDPTGIGANVFARANHTGTQAQSTIVNLVSDLAAKADAAATASAIAAKLDTLQPFATIASAATTDLSTVTSQNVTVTGNTTITGFGTAPAGTLRRLVFSGALTLTHNATTLILPQGANVVTAAGDSLQIVSLGSGNWRVTSYQRVAGSLLTSGTAAAAAGNTAVDFTSIPSWVKRITVMVESLSTNGSSGFSIQIGDSGGVENTGYVCATGNAQTSTTEFPLTGTSGAAAGVYHGSAVLTLLNAAANTWVVSSQVARTDVLAVLTVAGSKSTSAVLDRVRVKTGNGTDTFDAGSINIVYE
ncbi:hypothetical protein EVC08_060 [Rhizobium phage RHph_N65]|nr:hypothetical protein EVC08_060 [Rhizobium phage RHph_N65]